MGTEQGSPAIANGGTFTYSDLDLLSIWGTEWLVGPQTSVIGSGHSHKEVSESGAKYRTALCTRQCHSSFSGPGKPLCGHGGATMALACAVLSSFSILNSSNSDSSGWQDEIYNSQGQCQKAGTGRVEPIRAIPGICLLTSSLLPAHIWRIKCLHMCTLT